MSFEVLEKLIRGYLALDFGVAGFSWQGGEPTLMGLRFYEEVVELQKKYGRPGRQIGNALQTNAVLLDDEWCRFLHNNKFLVGISIDGPKKFHDHYRVDHAGCGTFDKVMRAIENCKRYKVEFNTLTLLNDVNVEHPEELFDFFADSGVRFLQFIPCVELDEEEGGVTGFSVTPQQYGDFLCRLFDRWYEYGPEKVSIRDFDSILSFYVTGEHTICTFGRQCSQYVVVEHTGDCFPCDFFVQPKWRLGNIMETPIEQLAGGEKKRKFGRLKQNLSNKCLLCSSLSVCRGGCMKDRAPFDRDSFGRESYFCEGYKRFFEYSGPRFMQLAASVRAASRHLPQPFL